MTFRRNIEREDTLLSHWRLGRTVKTASLLSGIPEGSVGYYYRRFNNNKKEYLKIVNGKFQDPPRTRPSVAREANLYFTKVMSDLNPMLKDKKFSEARDYLQFILLFGEFMKKHQRILDNIDPKKKEELLQLMGKDIINFYLLKNI